ncbi:MAG: hypothetical protein KDE26_31520 [Bacteroidetes bacterium]|nr:hypothetical protein [Bacteroidota bacterium]MCB0847840.1 hypothetical protein [Bacteroidota bacterium]
MNTQDIFQEIVEAFTENYPSVKEGKMMSSAGLKVNGKVFCFFHEGEMCFKLGKNADTDRPELAGFRHLDPFKNKPPLTAWYYIPFTQKRIWEMLAEEAMLMTEGGK